MEDQASLSDGSGHYDTQLTLGKSHSNTLIDTTIMNYEVFQRHMEVEQICCVELINNNKIVVNYEDQWSIRDVK